VRQSLARGYIESDATSPIGFIFETLMFSAAPGGALAWTPEAADLRSAALSPRCYCVSCLAGMMVPSAAHDEGPTTPSTVKPESS
jgi:hypothetical protein